MKPSLLITITIATLAIMTLVIFNYVMQPHVLPSTEYFNAIQSSRNTNQEPIDQGTTTPTTNTNTNIQQPSELAVDAVQLHVATRFGVHENDVIVLRTVSREWPDSCLGVPVPDEMCLQVITPGYEVKVQVEGEVHYYHTNSDGTVIREPSWSMTQQLPPYVKLHQPCASDSECEPGVTCVSYYGIAGGQGPLFATCEIPCMSDSQCTNGMECTTIADGPGSVCY